MSSSMPTVNTTCAYCGVGCGISIQVKDTDKRSVNLDGDPAHPANFGKLCAKGATLAETIGLEKRLLQPIVDGLPSDWQTATQTIADKLTTVIKEEGPQAIGIYLSGQLLTEDYYVANKFAKGFLGTANIDTNSRLCMSSSVVGHKRAFGEDAVPTCYEDLDHADLMVIVGSNTAWCHPIVFQRIKKAKTNNPKLKIVVIDPRKTDTCDIADLHLGVTAGSDVILFNGLLNWLADQDAINKEFIDNHTQGFTDALATAQAEASDLSQIAERCELNESDLKTFYQWFSDTEKTITFYSQGVNQSTSGSDKVNAIINCHLATGRIGKEGMGPFSLTGQPNAMGGREVGGLANQLAAHMDFDEDSVDRVQRFWHAPNMATQPGLKTIDMFEAAREGKIKVLWIMATNPAVSLPNSNSVREALRNCELVIVSDCIADTDTMAYAHIKLPAQGWGEKEGTVTNSERRISRQRAFLTSPQNALPDWQIVADVAKKMGYSEDFNYSTVADVFKEHAALSCFENSQEAINYRLRLFNLEALATLNETEYDQMQPVQWPTKAQQENKRLFANGIFATESTRAHFISVKHKAVANALSEQYPLQLNTGRIRDQWHTMTRTAFAKRLNAHKPQPFVEIHPKTALERGINDGDIIQVSSQWGSLLALASLTEQIQPKQVFVPMHWNDQFAPQGRIGPVVNPNNDPYSGQPELKHTPVNLQRVMFSQYAKCWTRKELTMTEFNYWVKIPEEHNLRYELANNTSMAQLVDAMGTSPTLTYKDSRTGIYRYGWIKDNRLEACLFLGNLPIEVNDRWLSQLFTKTNISDNERNALLSGKSPPDVEDCGRIVCACYSVGEKTITKAISNGCGSAIEVGDATKAGTNCGSCVGEINQIIEQATKQT
ncbi:MAG: molybdopterin-dependent oxidoreductase [Pseudomonadales bacterium]|nr:molybdopterin-dependent oxidoreductase [Pseudomonadales bacterium]